MKIWSKLPHGSLVKKPRLAPPRQGSPSQRGLENSDGLLVTTARSMRAEHETALVESAQENPHGLCAISSPNGKVRRIEMREGAPHIGPVRAARNLAQA